MGPIYDEIDGAGGGGSRIICQKEKHLRHICQDNFEQERVQDQGLYSTVERYRYHLEISPGFAGQYSPFGLVGYIQFLF